MLKIIKLSEIDIKHSPLPRAEINEETVLDYVECYFQKKKMPPMQVFKVDGRDGYLLADGRHRYEALKRLKKEDCCVDLDYGDWERCLSAALIGNTQHGLRRSNADKRACVLLALKQWPDKSNNEIAQKIQVSHTLVDKVVLELKQESSCNVATPKSEKPQNAEEKRESEKNDTPRKVLDTISGTKPANTPKDEPAKPAKMFVVVDSMGLPIPEMIIPIFKRRGEIREIINELLALKRKFLDIGDRKDVLYRRFNFQDADVTLSNLINNLRFALPEIVCTQCQGHPETQPHNACPVCQGKGMISESYYGGITDSSRVPDALKKVREKQIENAQKRMATANQQAAL